MIYEPKNIDLSILAEHFIVSEEYTQGRCLAELIERQELPDFLVLIDEEAGNINGFMIGYRVYDTLWLNQVWRQNDSKLSNSVEAMIIAKEWAIKRGLTSITAETKRNEMAVLKRWGFEEISVIVRVKL